MSSRNATGSCKKKAAPSVARFFVDLDEIAAAARLAFKGAKCEKWLYHREKIALAGFMFFVGKAPIRPGVALQTGDVDQKRFVSMRFMCLGHYALSRVAFTAGHTAADRFGSPC
jgi:hypothetical protein